MVPRQEMAHWLRIFKSLQMELSKSDLAAAADGSDDDDDDDDDDEDEGATQGVTAALAATDGGLKDVPLTPASPTASEASSLVSPSTSGGTSGLPTGDKAGYMGKRNQAGVWKVRWFVLKDKLLQYYKVRAFFMPRRNAGRTPPTANEARGAGRCAITPAMTGHRVPRVHQPGGRHHCRRVQRRQGPRVQAHGAQPGVHAQRGRPQGVCGLVRGL